MWRDCHEDWKETRQRLKEEEEDRIREEEEEKALSHGPAVRTSIDDSEAAVDSLSVGLAQVGI